MLKNKKFMRSLRNLVCSFVSSAILAECPISVFATDDQEDKLPKMDEGAFSTAFPGDSYDVPAEPDSSWPSFINLTDDAFDVTGFGGFDDTDKPVVFSLFAEDLGNIFSSMLKCNNLAELKRCIESNIFIRDSDPALVSCMERLGLPSDEFCMDTTDFAEWYNKMAQLIQKDEHFLKGADRDQFLDFRVLFLRESFLRAVYASVCTGIDASDLTKQRVYMINRNLFTFISNHRGIISTDELKLVYGRIGNLLLNDKPRKCFANCFLSVVDSKKYRRNWKLSSERDSYEEMDFWFMDDFNTSKSILIRAYAKLKEAYELSNSGYYREAYACVGKSLEMMEEFKVSYRKVLPFSSPLVISEYSLVFPRWNKIKNTIDSQIFVCKKFDDYRNCLNDLVNLFLTSSDRMDIDWFEDVDDSRMMVMPDSDPFDVNVVTRLINQAIDLRDEMEANYDKALLSCPRIQSILNSVDKCVDNLSRLKSKIEEQVKLDINKAEKAKRKEELKRSREERQERLKLKREKSAADELLRLAEEAKQRRAQSACGGDEEDTEYEITYINDDVKAESLRFLRSDRKLGDFWKKWFNDVRVTGSSTMNFLPNMRSQRAVFLRFKRGLIRLAPNDVIYEARLDTSGEKNGVRIVYYIEKDSNKVVILYVGEPFGVIHKNVVSVVLDYANFPEANLEDCEAVVVSSSVAGSESEAAEKTSNQGCSVAGSGSDSSSKLCDSDEEEKDTANRHQSNKKRKDKKKHKHRK